MKSMSILLSAVLLVACVARGGQQGGDFLSYMEHLDSVVGRAELDGMSYELVFSIGGEGRVIELTAPESLAGMKFIEQADGYIVRYGDFSTHFASCELCDRLIALFSLSEDDVVSTKIERASGRSITRIDLTEGRTVRLSEEGDLLMLSDGVLTFFARTSIRDEITANKFAVLSPKRKPLAKTFSKLYLFDNFRLLSSSFAMGSVKNHDPFFDLSTFFDISRLRLQWVL